MIETQTSPDFIRDIAKLSPKQNNALASALKNRYTLYAGGRGGGKTRTLVTLAFVLQILYANAAYQKGTADGSPAQVPNGVIAASNLTNLKTRVVPHIQELLSPYGYVQGHTTDGIQKFKFFDKALGSITLCSLHDPEDIRGQNIPYLLIDEAQEIPEEQFHKIHASVRYSGPMPLPHLPIFLTANPDGVGADWLFKYFVDKSFSTPLGEAFKPSADQFFYVPSTLMDHPDTNYQQAYRYDLSKLSHSQRRMWLYGEWVMDSGRRFSCPIREINPFEIPSHWTRAVGFDWGFNDPSAAVWVAFSETGDAYVYREYIQNNITPSETAAELRRLSNIEPIAGYFCDPSIFNRDAHGNGLNRYFEEEQLYLTRSTNDHSITNPLIEAMLGSSPATPRLYVFRDAAPKLIQSLQSARWGESIEPRKREKLEPHSVTHLIYALGYVLYKYQQITPSELKPQVHPSRLRLNQHLMGQLRPSKGNVLR